MGSRDLATFHRDLDLIAGSGTVAGLGDVDLLERFLGGREAVAEAAFEAIVTRHGPMVQGICRSLLRDPADARRRLPGDVPRLVRKARSIRIKDSLRPWLYGVAWRVALKVRAVARRRRSRETSGDLDRAIDPREPDSSDLRPILLEELERLPDRYRIPIVLFHLEGRTHEQVAGNSAAPSGPSAAGCPAPATSSARDWRGGARPPRRRRHHGARVARVLGPVARAGPVDGPGLGRGASSRRRFITGPRGDHVHDRGQDEARGHDPPGRGSGRRGGGRRVFEITKAGARAEGRGQDARRTESRGHDDPSTDRPAPTRPGSGARPGRG